MKKKDEPKRFAKFEAPSIPCPVEGCRVLDPKTGKLRQFTADERQVFGIGAMSEHEVPSP